MSNSVFGNTRAHGLKLQPHCRRCLEIPFLLGTPFRAHRGTTFSSMVYTGCLASHPLCSLREKCHFSKLLKMFSKCYPVRYTAVYFVYMVGFVSKESLQFRKVAFPRFCICSSTSFFNKLRHFSSISDVS